MGVSFKVSKVGRRYRPDLFPVEDEDGENGSSDEPQLREKEADAAVEEDNVTYRSNVFAKPRALPPVSEDLEVSFSVNLFSNGFSFGKVTELFSYAPKLLHPYDRASEKLFSAIEFGYLPGDLFDDMPCTYINGAILCEIRDYRDCFAYMVNASSSANGFPTIHRVVLQMGIENVVKDISSISNNSWTYEDLLKVESAILKALQPNLHLNPTPVLGTLFEKPMTKKLDLRIPWSWKRRKLSGAPTTELAFSNPFHGTYVPGISLDQNKSQFNLTYQDRVTCTQWSIPSSSSNSHEDSVVQENILQSIPLSSLSNHQGMLNSTRTIPTSPALSKSASAPKQCYSDSAETATFIFDSRGNCNMQEMQEPIQTKPKGELLDFSQPQPLGSLAETIDAPHLELRSKLAQQRLEAEKSLGEILNRNKNQSLALDKGQQAILGCVPTLQSGNEMFTCNMRQALAEISEAPSMDVGMNGDSFLLRDMGSNQYNFQPLKLQISSPSSIINVPPTSTQGNQVDQPVGHNMASGTISQKRKALQNHQIFTDDECAPVDSSLSDSFMKELSQLAQKISNSCFKGLDLKVGGSTSTTTINKVNEKTPPEEDSCLHQSFEAERDPLIMRFSNISMVTQRYGLIHRKHKSNNLLGRRPFSSVNPLVGINLLNPNNDENSKDAITDGISLSNFLYRSPDVSKTRTLTFIRLPRVNQGKNIPLIDNGDQKKLIISERLNEGIIQASVLYGHEEKIDSIDFPFPPTISSAQYADLFATQFTSLMVREGYQLSSDQIESTPLSTDGGSSGQQSSPTSSAIAIAGTVEVTTGALMPLPSSQVPMSSSVSTLDLWRSLSQKVLSREHVLPIGITRSALNLSAGQLSKPQANTAAQLSSIQQHWPHIFNKHALLQSQMQQRQRQTQLLQRKVMMGGFGVSEGKLGTIQLNGGIQGIANIGLGSFNDAMDMDALTSRSVGGHISGIGNMGEVNNLGSNITSFNGSKQLFDGFTDPVAAVLGSQERVLSNGVSIQGGAAEKPMQLLNILDMTLNLTNQQLPQQPLQQLHQHLPGLSQELEKKIRSPPLPLPTKHASLVEHITSSPSQLKSLKFGRQSQLNLQQLSTGSAPSQQQRGGGNAVVGPESLEPNSHAHGSVNSSNAGSVGNQSG